jgi:hypothetical protein
MADNRCSCGQGSGSSGSFSSNVGRDTICIDTFRVLDACRDKDCYEDVRVYLSSCGQEILDRTTNVRVKCANIVCAYIGVDEVPFNKGFYQVTIRFYVKVVAEACIGNGRGQEIEGISIIEKKVVLFGSEGNVNIYRSSDNIGFCSDCSSANSSTNTPVAVVEAVEPIVLSSRIADCSDSCGYCCCSCCEIPESVCNTCSSVPIDSNEGNRLYVSLGIFSVVRIERPAQYLINAADYCVPDKECVTNESDDPCSIFRRMAFPTNEFCPRSYEGNNHTGNCGK